MCYVRFSVNIKVEINSVYLIETTSEYVVSLNYCTILDFAVFIFGGHC